MELNRDRSRWSTVAARTALSAVVLLLVPAFVLQFPNFVPAYEAGRLISVPYFAIHLERLWGLAVAGAVVLSALAAGDAVAGRRLAALPLAALERSLLCLVTGVVVISTATFGLLLAGWLSPVVWVAMAALPIVRHRTVRALLSRSAAELREYAGAECRYLGWPSFAFLLLLLCFNAGLHFVSNLYPATDTDAVNYHLGPIRLYAETGRWTPMLDIHNIWPEGMHMLYTLAFQAGGQVAARLLHFLMFPALLAAAVAAIRRQAMPPVVLLVANILLAVPIVSNSVGASMGNDVAVAFFLMVALNTLASWTETKSRTLFVLAAVSVGAALSAKQTALLALPFCGLVFFAIAPPPHRRWDRPALQGALFLIVALAVALPWYAKTYYLTGNPVWPALTGLFPGPLDDVAREMARSADSFIVRRRSDFAALPYLVSFGPGNRHDGTFGPWALLFLLPAMVWSPRKPAARVLWAFLLVAGTAWVLLLADVRYGIFLLVPLLLLGTSAVFRTLAREAGAFGHVMRWSFRGGMAALLMISLPPFYQAQYDPQRYTPLVQQRFPDAASFPPSSPPFSVRWRNADEWYLTRMLPDYPAVAFLNANTPRDARVLYIGTSAPSVYLERELLWVNRAGTRQYFSSSTPPQVWLTRLTRFDIRYVFIDQVSTPGHWLLDEESADIFSRFRLAYEAAGHRVYEHRMTPLTGQRPPVYRDLLRATEGERADPRISLLSHAALMPAWLTVNGDVRRAVTLNSTLQWEIVLDEPVVLSFASAGEGVGVSLTVSSRDGGTFRGSYEPTAPGRPWNLHEVDLSRFAGGRVLVTFRRTFAPTEGSQSWAAVAQPLLIRTGRSRFE